MNNPGYHGQVWNAAEPARSLGIGQTTVRRYLDLISNLFMVRQLPADDLKLDRLAVVYPGPMRYPIADRVEAVPLPEVVGGIEGLFPNG